MDSAKIEENVVQENVTNNEVIQIDLPEKLGNYTVIDQWLQIKVEDIYGNLSSSNAISKYPTATVLTEEEQANPEEKVKVAFVFDIKIEVNYNVTKGIKEEILK